MHEQGLIDAIDRALQKAAPISGKVHERIIALPSSREDAAT